MLSNPPRFLIFAAVDYLIMKKTISTPNAPAAIGPYSQAVWVNGTLYISGQIPDHPQTGELATGIEAETHQVMENLRAILTAAEMDFSNVVKTSIFLTDIENHFGIVNEIYASYFSGHYPARETIEVAKLPKNVSIEISMIAHKDEEK